MNPYDSPQMTPEEIELGLKSLDRDHPFARATIAAIANYRTNCIDQSLAFDLAPEKRAFLAGSASAMVLFLHEYLTALGVKDTDSGAASDNGA